MTDYYKILGLKPDASLEDIKTAYRKLSKKFHPDFNENDKFFEERFLEIQEAYENLSKNFGAKNGTSEKYSNFTHNKKDTDAQSKGANTSKANSIKTDKFKGVGISVLIIAVIFIGKEYIQKSIRKEAVNSSLEEYRKKNETNHNSYEMSKPDRILSKSDQEVINDTSTSINKNTEERFELLKDKPLASKAESEKWLLQKLNKYAEKECHLAEIMGDPWSEYDNYTFTIEGSNLLVGYKYIFHPGSNCVLRNYENIKICKDVIYNVKVKIPICECKLEKSDDYSITFVSEHFKIIEFKDGDKNEMKYFEFRFNLAKEDNLFERLNDAFNRIKTFCVNKSSIETF